MSGRFYLAIPRDELDAIRAARHDEAGNPLDTLIHRDGGAPLRCCLRETRPAERVLLIAYTPPGTAGAYAERGPVFIHADRCGGYLTPAAPELSHASGPTTGGVGSRTACWSRTDARPRPSSKNS
jgi:hypothetical protein